MTPKTFHLKSGGWGGGGGGGGGVTDNKHLHCCFANEKRWLCKRECVPRASLDFGVPASPNR